MRLVQVPDRSALKGENGGEIIRHWGARPPPSPPEGGGTCVLGRWVRYVGHVGRLHRLGKYHCERLLVVDGHF